MAEGWSDNLSTWQSGLQRLCSITSPQPCRYFKQGNCIYADNCRYSHGDVGISAEIAPSNSLPPMKCDHLSTSDVKTTTRPTMNVANSSRLGNLEDWVNAPEFVPTNTKRSGDITDSNHTPTAIHETNIRKEAGPSSELKSYAKAVDPAAGQKCSIAQSNAELCPYFMMGSCRYEEECVYIHGDMCELCCQYCLHPTDEAQRQQHNQDCVLQHEVDMEQSFAIARSKEKVCGICMEVVWEKMPPAKQRFGLLPNCSHCFCLDCIRTWRQAKQFENKIVRSCPECRVQSDFVCPSRNWCETKEEKHQLIEDYKKALSKKACKYFNQGRGECPFGNKCFYLHALPDGTQTDVGPPQGTNRRRRIGPDDDEADIVRFLLWDFMEERESRLYLQLGLDFDEIDHYFSDSDVDDSDDNSSIFFFQ